MIQRVREKEHRDAFLSFQRDQEKRSMTIEHGYDEQWPN